jgi:transposase
MEKKRREIDFSNQVFYIGIDVHKKSWAVTIRNSGIEIKTMSMEPNPTKLTAYMQTHYPSGTYRSVYEAGFCGYSIDRELRACGVENIVVNPASIPINHKEKLRKTDVIDSRKLARELEKESLCGIYIPDVNEEGFRSLCRLRSQLVGDQTRVKNRIKSLLDFLGVSEQETSGQRNWSGSYIKKLQERRFEDVYAQKTLQNLLSQLQEMKTRIADLMQQIKEDVRKDEKKLVIIKRLMTVPGIGFTTAIILYSELMNMERFSRFDKLCCYIGLVPDVRSSGEKETVIGLSKMHLSHVRSILIEAAWTAVRNDAALTAAFSELSKRMCKQKAIIRISKKLLNRIMCIWKHNEEYVTGVVA